MDLQSVKCYRNLYIHLLTGRLSKCGAVYFGRKIKCLSMMLISSCSPILKILNLCINVSQSDLTNRLKPQSNLIFCLRMQHSCLLIYLIKNCWLLCSRCQSRFYWRMTLTRLGWTQRTNLILVNFWSISAEWLSWDIRTRKWMEFHCVLKSAHWWMSCSLQTK